MADSAMGQRLIFIDLETGGGDPKRHPIIQLAAVAVDHHSDVLEAFEAKLAFNPKCANAYSLRKNHYHPGIWATEAREPQIVAQDFAHFLRRHATVPTLSSKGDRYEVAQLVAHNASFDGPFLEKWFERLKIFLPARRQILCTLQLDLWHFAFSDGKLPANFQLATLCAHFGVPFHAATAHEALADAVANMRLYCTIAGLTKSANDLVQSSAKAA